MMGQIGTTQAGDVGRIDSRARGERVAEHQGLVRKIASAVWTSVAQSVSLDDLLGYGQLGLIEAIDRYRPDMGCEFSTFAYYRIRGAMLDGLCKMRGMSKRMAEKARFLRGFQDMQAMRVDERSTADKDTNQLAEAINESLHDGLVLFLLSQGATETEAEEAGSAEDEILDNEWKTMVRRGISQLPATEADLVKKVYFEGLNLSEAADALGVSRSWACRLHQRAIALLKRSVDRHMNPAPTASVIR